MKWIRQTLWAFAVVAVLALGLSATLRWFANSEEARADVALLMAPQPAPAGRSGFAALTLIDHDVPVDRLDAVMAEEVARFEAFERIHRESMLAMSRKSPHSGPEAGLAYVLLEDSDYPAREPVDVAAATCRWEPQGCLDYVRGNVDAVRALLAQEHERTGLAARALASDHLHNPFPASLAAPIPSFQKLRLPLTAAALDAVDGRIPESMSRTCGILADARRHGAGSTDLISKMIMGSLSNAAAGLLLEVRRASPDTPLPAECAVALAPVQGEHYLVCDALRGEFRMSSRIGHQLDAALADKWNPRDLMLRFVAYDADTQDAWMAPRYADTCRDDYRRQVLAGTVPASRGREMGMSDPTCWGAVVSCVLSGISMMDTARYQGRMLDHAAKLRLQLAALAVADGRLSREAAATAGASPGYPVLATPAGDLLAITMQQPGQNQDPSFSIGL